MSLAKSILFCGALLALSANASAVTMSWSYVGDLGNAAGSIGLGAVDHPYYIGKYDVTNRQYVEFLNAKDPSGANQLGLYTSNMSNVASGGITFNSSGPLGSKYTLIAGDEDHPVTSVTWYSAARFTNWLNNGQGASDTESGAYTFIGGGIQPPSPSHRNSGAEIFLPTRDEWFKAAYYNPVTSSYFDYPTGSSSPPIASGPSGLPNSANYNKVVNHPTNVGAYTGTTSPYGAFDMGGNVWQMTETLFGLFRSIGGGSYFNDASFMKGNSQSDFDTIDGQSATFMGFRVAMIPEPSTLALAAFGFIGLAAWRWRRSR